MRLSPSFRTPLALCSAAWLCVLSFIVAAHLHPISASTCGGVDTSCAFCVYANHAASDAPPSAVTLPLYPEPPTFLSVASVTTHLHAFISPVTGRSPPA